jgi:outer membrane biogenesis lipoprotein LolB
MAPVSLLRTFAFCLLPFALLSASCGAHRFAVPTGAGKPAPEAAAAWAEATSRCRSVRTFSAELHLSGRAGQRRVRGPVQGAVTSDGQIRLEMPAPFGQPVFILGGSADRATLLLPRSNQFLVARSGEILDALVGVKVEPQRLLALLSGCYGDEGRMTSAARYKDLIGITTDKGQTFLRQQGARWQIAAAVTSDLIVDYPDVDYFPPRRLRMASPAGQTPALDLSITSNQIELDSSLGPSTFVVVAPASAVALTLEDLRAGGPLGTKEP